MKRKDYKWHIQMKDIAQARNIVPDKLAAFVYQQDGGIDILQKSISEWNDVEYLSNFFDKNSQIFETSSYFSYGYSFEDFLEDIMQDLEQLEDFIELLRNNDVELDDCFCPLSEKEEKVKIFSLRKRRYKFLRVYSIRIDDNLHVITGGAIKITKTMQDHFDTKRELAQMDYSRQWLTQQGILTNDIFYCHFDL